MTRVMYDSTNPAAMPADGDLYAGYVDGQWPTFPTLHHDFPNAKGYVSITVLGNLSANVADQEKGDLTPQSAAEWAKGEKSVGRHPTIYTSESSWQECKDAVTAVGLDPTTDVSWWVAWWGHDGIPDGAVACQIESTQQYDKSLVADYWPGVDPVPTTTTAPPTTNDATTEAIVPNLPTLRRGSTGIAVRRLQGLLVADHRTLGHSGSEADGVDGSFGPLTEAAVQDVQHDNGIAVDGIVGHDTWTALLVGKP